jgi:hypothetical protein
MGGAAFASAMRLGFAVTARTRTFPPESVLPAWAARSESLSHQVSPLLVWRSHCAVKPSLGCVVFPDRTTLATVKQHSEIHSSSLACLRVLPNHT